MKELLDTAYMGYLDKDFTAAADNLETAFYSVYEESGLSHRIYTDLSLSDRLGMDRQFESLNSLVSTAEEKYQKNKFRTTTDKDKNSILKLAKRIDEQEAAAAAADAPEAAEEEVALLMGRSGSGKTTLLHMLAGLLTPIEGKVWLDDTNLYALPDGALSRLRNAEIGVIPQGRSAVDTLMVMENVLLPQQLRGKRGDAEAALRWLDALGIADLRDARPAELSGGELRRMAVARALAGNPSVLLADEPTGDLDDENTQIVLSLLQRAAIENGKAVLLVTHDSEALPYGTRTYRMESGTLREDAPKAPSSIGQGQQML